MKTFRKLPIVSLALTLIITFFLAALTSPAVAAKGEQADAMTPANLAYLRHLYLDLLARAITPAEEKLLLSLLTKGYSRYQVAQKIIDATEYRMRLVQSFYKKYLNRAANSNEQNFFINLLANGGTDEQVIQALVSSDEYFSNAGATNGKFLGQLYQDLLGRPIDPPALAAFLQFLQTGHTRQQVADQIVNSQEYRSNLVQALYKNLLNRPADSGELNSFVNFLANGGMDEGAITLIVIGDEYFHKISYNICLGDNVRDYKLKLDSATGDYVFTDCHGITIGGKGTIKTIKCVVVMKDNNLRDRAVSAAVNICAKQGTASVQIFSISDVFIINDDDITDNACTCSPRAR